jgi:hypothetical protein
MSFMSNNLWRECIYSPKNKLVVAKILYILFTLNEYDLVVHRTSDYSTFRQ